MPTRRISRQIHVSCLVSALAAGLFLNLTKGEAQAPPSTATLPATSSTTSEAPTIVVVFDGSASMWGKPDGETKSKLAIARDAVRLATAKLPPTTRIGLVSFGHRRSGDCADVETLVKPAAQASERINATLEKHNPRGRGPITQALREAAKELGAASAQSRLILIHDDLDNCQADPCSALADLRNAHPKVVVHVVSLAMKREDAQRMMCLTRPTGGTLTEATTPQQVNLAIDAAMRVVAPAGSEATSQARPAKADTAGSSAGKGLALPLAPQKPGLQLTVSLAAGAPPIDTAVRWRVLRAGQTEAPPVHESDASAPFVDVPPGRYEIEAQYGFVLARTTAELAAGEGKIVNLALGAGVVQLLEPGSMSLVSAGVARDAVITFTRLQSTGAVETGPNAVSLLRGLPPEIALAPGHYLVALTSGALRLDRPIEIRAGERTTIQPSLGLGELILQATSGAGGPALDSVLYTIYEDDPDAPQGRREIQRSAAFRPVFALPAGTYYAIARHGTTETRERLTVRSGERIERIMSLETARLQITARLPGRQDVAAPVSLRLERLDEPKDVAHSNRGVAVFDVQAGRYRLEGRIGNGNARIEREIDVKAGSREQLTLEPVAGSLKVRLMDASGANVMPDVVWDIRDRAGRVVWSATDSEARPILLQGRYSVRAEARNRRVVREIEVRAGETRSVDLTGP